MKALIRNPGETVAENDGIVGIDWNTGAPLTNPTWAGGPYQLVENYIEVADGGIYDVATYPEPEDILEAAPAPEPDPVVEEEETVVINGVTYTKAQLRKMLGE